MAELGSTARASLSVSEPNAGSMMVTVSGELDVMSVEALENQIDELLTRNADEVVIDLSGLEFMDSSGISLFLRLANRFGPITVRRPSPMVRRVIEVVGVSHVIRIEPD